MSFSLGSAAFRPGPGGRLSLFLLAAFLFAANGARAAATAETPGRDGLRIENERISVLITGGLSIIPALKVGDSLLTPVAGGIALNPAFSITVGGLVVDDFRVDWSRLKSEEVSDELGPGKLYRISAVADQYLKMLYAPIRIGVEVRLAFYDRFPTVVLAQAVFTNLGGQRLQIDKVVSQQYRLDRRLLDPEEQPWRFASYQGAATRWGWDYSLIWITPDFDRRNFMGQGELASREVAGGGTPLIDLWSPRCGLALASAETSQQWISFPVRAARDGLVEIAVAEAPDERLGQKIFLAPGGSYTTIRTSLILHRLDFYTPLHTYADMLRARGIGIPLSSPPEAYEPYWKSWGLRMDFTLQQIYASLGELKKIGISWANLDDGWFTWYGDWDPNPAPGKFPGGEPDMRAFVSRLHREGFKTSLWWYPQGVSEGSRLAREHPEWLVQNEDGSLPKSKRGLYYLCPVQPECLEFITGMVRKIMADWGYDGLYIDTQDLTATPPCFNPAHHHHAPLDSYQGQPKFYEAVYRTAQQIKPGCPVEMCICAMPHDPFKMPYYNVANASDPINLEQVRRRIKVEKAFRGPTFCVGDCYQVPADEWEGFSVPESFESAIGTGAQVTTFFTDLSPAQEKKWKDWIAEYRKLGLAWSEYLNLYDIAFDKPEGHVVRKGDTLYYGFYAPYWSVGLPLELRGLEPGRKYRVRDYAEGLDLGLVSAENPVIRRGFKDQLLLEVSPLK
ncbi:MAG: hypothetical protein A3F83_08330 [Candidatus Glassbacteria bacterium RIFCSPLOWO2_12_FULL_58_11]|uniref:Alpha-galactosidase n=1 Tax=Candidatus Glassbacteria bacterium RIFCSPLOWO2_12_FULL_58_11 TaxID=1817867 RepID=A0A1F5YZ02_9BACT|nr:MAG: hypothetical protein A3F83_08330 [Candidatus Glassbacteria bacterium RIFCSPLOWO2_12_FULL_58_11]